MGIVRTAESRKAKLEEFRQMLLERSGFQRKDEKKRGEGEFREVRGVIERENKEEEEKLVCVTSGVSFVGVAIVNFLLDRGYSVRIAVDNEEDLEKLREMDMLRDESNNNNVNRVSAVMAKVTDIESMCEAFQGCRGVFHTSAFADPGGVSGYSKCMAELEVRAVENVMEACGRTESVKKCVFTSSLLTCIWRDHSLNDLPSIIDHSCWSDESICREKKLWFALGKTKAERAAWRLAQVSELKLATICQALVTGPEFCRRNPTASIAYLKGAHDMYAMGLLATVDVKRMAEAHVCVYEAMSNGASGRYICFDRMIRREEEAAEIERLMRLPENMISGDASSSLSPQFELCNRKLLRLMSTPARCSSE